MTKPRLRTKAVRVLLAVVTAMVACSAFGAVALAAPVQQASAAAPAKQKIVIGNRDIGKLVYTSKHVGLRAKAKTKLSFTSSNENIVVVSKKGNLKLMRAGKARITIRAKATKRYKAAKRTVTVRVLRAKQVIKAPSYHKTLRSKPFKVKAKVKGKARVTFSSNRPDVAAIDRTSGKVVLGGMTGIATIKIKATKTPRFKKRVKRVIVCVASYPYAFGLTKNKGTFSLKSLMTTSTLQRRPVAEGLRKCNELTPQGVCTHGKYILLTAYCHFHSNGEVKHNSVLHVLDKKTKKAVKTLVLPEVSYGNHVGAVTVDESGGIWIAGSTSRRVLYLTKKRFDEALAAKGSSVRVKYDKIKLRIDGESATFINFADGLLWVGSYGEYSPSTLYVYKVSKDDDGIPSALTLKSRMSVTAGANGVALYENGSQRFLVVSRMVGGRLGYSELVFYRLTGSGATMKLAEVGGVSLPCMAEQIHIENNATCYLVYESWARWFQTNEDGNGTPVETVKYGTIGKVGKLFDKALKFGPA